MYKESSLLIAPAKSLTHLSDPQSVCADGHEAMSHQVGVLYLIGKLFFLCLLACRPIVITPSFEEREKLVEESGIAAHTYTCMAKFINFTTRVNILH